MTTEKKALTTMQKGIIISLVLIAASVLIQITVTDMQQQQKFGWLNFILLLAGIVWACWSYSEEKNKNVTFGNLFAHGFKTTAVVTSFLVIYSILSVTVLFPEMREKAMEVASKQMEEQGQLSETQIEQALSFTDKFFLPLAIGGALIGNLIIGTLGALIGAGIAPKNPNYTPFESDNVS
jgi:membrane protease YdiL (CAAX protease family)